MDLKIHKTAQESAIYVANQIAEQIRSKPDSTIGFPTGRTMNAVYFHLVTEYKDSLDCSQVKAFIIDEYVGLKDQHQHSFAYYMKNNLYDHLNFKKENLFFPDVHSDNLDLACSDYESKIVECGGLDLIVLGIGTNGHIALNEPGSSVHSRTRLVALSQQTMNSNRPLLGHDKMPLTAITMGIETICEAKRVVLLATGTTKASIIRRLVDTEPHTSLPASFLMNHQNFEIVLGPESSKQLN
jgi:glucosamine-6-phosphate deaminase